MKVTILNINPKKKRSHKNCIVRNRRKRSKKNVTNLRKNPDNEALRRKAMRAYKYTKAAYMERKAKHQTIIVGYSALHHQPKYYYTGHSFAKKRSEAKVFNGDAAKFEAKRILPILPPILYGIKVEKA